jgi:hypothetical protein
VVVTSFHGFFLALASAGLALIGVLLVALSVNAGRSVGPRARLERQVVAASALTALATGFVISTEAMVPSARVGINTMVTAGAGFLVSLILVIRLGRHQVRHGGYGLRSDRLVWLFGLSAVAAGFYGYELVLGRQLARHITDQAVSTLAFVVLIIDLLGLLVAWTLLGAPFHGPRAWLNPLEDRQPEETTPEARGSTSASTTPSRSTRRKAA